MKKILMFAAVAMATMAATPAMAQDATMTGPRVGVLAGVTGDDSPVDDAEFTYGVVAGYDFEVSPGFSLGVEADYTEVSLDTGDFDVDNRQLSAAVRATKAVSPSAALFVSAGYSNLRFEEEGVSIDFDGFRVGGGAEFAITPRFYATTEYRYSEYDLSNIDAGNEGVHSALLGLGVRF